ncbi:MAG: teichoic acid ABC transporter ATP-binding protein [Chloroflexi bacterium RBG_16_48_8]|nr:MAG: teichoic acid ABC transporter ATP-binding protein [Chloroflexi bacterium RBG_16_48_8]
MNNAVIELESVSVRYRVPEERIGTFKEYMIRRIQGKVKDRDFWALHDVDLKVHKGEVFGVIGRNGAGKSTMLKIVSRVLRPTKGRVRVMGCVAPLLELGAAFHHELTGRENIFLNAALLGHTQKQVEERFQKIVDFADISGFIDAPMRTYSTGMVARLGFSVATAWEPDILVLDEVLAVGDEAFQAKCHDRINNFRKNGATVLLVSHNTQVVKNICQRVAWIDQGVIQAVGVPEEIVQLYRGV